MREGYLKLVAFLALAACLLIPSAAWAQSLVSGQVDGTVTDATGAVAPNATVNLSNSETAFNETTTTSATGTFHFPLVKPGNYTLTVTLSGFSTQKRTVVVSLGQITNASVQLEIGKASQTIEVTAESPLLHTENANLATTVDQRTIEDIPSPGQDITNYAMTTPGVALSTGAGYGNLTANGLPGTSNLFTVNGNDYNDPYLNLNNSGASNLLLGANELQEITVVTNGYTGQYGRQAGANVNYTTKGGTNEFHGNAIWYYNGTVLNANDWFANATSPATPRPHDVSNQWAASLGGPVIKNKLFFFADSEGLRYVLPGGGPAFVPTSTYSAAAQANINAAFGGSSASSAFYQNIFKLYAGAPGVSRATPLAVGLASNTNPNGDNGGCGDFTTTAVAGQTNTYWGDGPRDALGNPVGTWTALPCAQTFFSTVNNLNTERLMSFTADWNTTAKDTLRFRYKQDRGVQATGTDPINAAFNANSIQPEDDGQMVWTHVFNGTMTNQFVMAGMYYSAIFGPPNIKATLAVFPTTIAFSDGVFNNMGGTDNSFPQGRNVTQAQAVDDFSWTRGRHVIKFGANFRKNYVSDFSMYPGTSGLITVASMTDFFGGKAVTTNGDTVGQSFANFGVQRVIYYSLGFYAQDEVKVTSNLTLTLALRLDRNSPETCQRNCFSRFVTQFQDLSHNVNTPYDQAVLTGQHSAFPNMQSIAWGPRVGFAWTPDTHLTKKGTTVFRGGFGLFPDLYPGFLADRFITNLPNVGSFTVSSGPFAPGQAGSVWTALANQNAALQSGYSTGGTQASLGILPNFSSVANNINNPLYYEWNFQVQQSIGTNTVLSVNYVGNHGTNIFVADTGMNSYCAVCGTAGHVASFGDLPNAAPDARFFGVRQYKSAGISNYNGMTLSVTRRFSHGLQGTFNYTYSHSLDDVSNGGLLPYSTQTGGDSITQQMDPYNLSKNYGNSDYDFRHYISANYYYAMPFKAQSRALNLLIGGWNTGGTIYWRTGEPFSVYNTRITGRILGNNAYLTRVLADYSGGATTCSGPVDGGLGNCLAGATFASYLTQNNFGNTGRNFFRGPHYFDTDFSLFKDFKIREQMAFTLGANAFNVLNHPNFANPVDSATSGLFGNILNTVSQPNSPYGNFQGAAVSGRVLQLMVKFKF